MKYMNASRLSGVKKQRGFTLLEMIVVLVIIGLLAGLVGPSLFRQADRAKVQTAETQIKMIRGALHAHRLDMGRFPSANEGLQGLVRAPSDAKQAQFWKGPYLDGDVPMDPWNRDYRYDLQGSGSEAFSLYSYGADGEPGGEDFNTDIGYLPQ